MYVRFYSTSSSYSGGILIVLERKNHKRKDNIDDDEDSFLIQVLEQKVSFVLQLLVAVI